MQAKLPEQTSLNILAQPLTDPSALPEHIPLAVGVIAAHSPQKVRQATDEALFEYSEHKRLTDFYAQAAERHEFKAIEELERVRSAYRDEIGAIEEVARETDSIDRLLELEGERKYYAEGLENAALDPSVQRAYKDVGTAATEQFEAEQRVLELQADADLANDIHEKYKKLGQRGRIGSYVAGVLLAAASITGTAIATSNHETSQVAKQYEASGFFVVPTMSLAGGYLLGDAGRDHFARRRAKRQIKRARRQSTN